MQGRSISAQFKANLDHLDHPDNAEWFWEAFGKHLMAEAL